jgi:hypothetical protein
MRKYSLFFLLAACHNRTVPATPAEKHLFVVSRPGAALYLDPVDSRVVMQKGSEGHFCSFRVGWTDSSAGTTPSREKERYFQYTAQYDWKALSGGDSLPAVLFQEKPGLNSLVKEGVVVFETPDGRQPDTLVYRDSYGSWGTQIFVLNRK